MCSFDSSQPTKRASNIHNLSVMHDHSIDIKVKVVLSLYCLYTLYEADSLMKRRAHKV